MNFRDLKSWSGYWKRLQAALLAPSVDQAELEASLQRARENVPVPVVWLLGKTQAGKTSIIRTLTGSDQAEIGNGFQACTRTARFYDFPPDAPVVRFLDTRGLGEVAYDPEEDIHYCESQAHLVVVVMKVADVRQDAVIDVLKTVRRRHPEWSVIIVHTGLHELYAPGVGHPVPYPFDSDPLSEAIPNDLHRALQAQRASMGKLPGSAPVVSVAVDFTLPEDGLAPADYGLEALWKAIESASSLGLERLLRGDAGVRGVYARSAHQHIVGYTLTAAGVGALPAVDLVAVSAVQAKLLHTLAALYGQSWSRGAVTEFVGLLGASVATGVVGRMVSKSVVKFIPFFGQTAGAVWGASTSGATTYALGKAAVYFFASRSAGRKVDSDTLRRVYAESLEAGSRLLKERFENLRK